MKYIVKAILSQIQSRIPKENEELLIKVSGFEDLEIYCNTAKNLDDFAKKSSISCNIKLANKKFKTFSENEKNKDLLNYMLKNDWVAEDKSITYYRNLPNQNLLVLLGTEAEDDKDGLRNTFEISPDTLFEDLNGDFTNVFPYFKENFSELELQTVNKVYKDLFEYVPTDICLLSKEADLWENQISSFDDWESLFFKELNDWQLPKRENNLPPLKSLKANNFIRPEYNFINLISFKKLTKKEFAKNLDRVEKYNIEQKDFYSGWDGWITQPINNYTDYTHTLISFIQGKDVEECKKKLLQCDYAIAEDILNLDIEGPKKEKNSVKKMTGDPLTVFTKTVLYSLSKILSESIPATKIKIEIQEIDLVTGFSSSKTNEEIEALKYAWQNFRIHTAGILDMINSREWRIDNTDVSIELKPNELFTEEKISDVIEEGFVKASSNTQFVNKVVYSVKYYDSQDKEILKNSNNQKNEDSYKWIFENNSDWLNEFTNFLDEEFLQIINTNTDYIPLFTIKKINDLLFSKSDDEFFDTLRETEVNYTYDICDYIVKSFNDKEDEECKAEFIKLGIAFKAFVKYLLSEGYYSASISDKKVLVSFIETYLSLGQLLTNKKLSQNKRSIYDAYLYAFNITDNSSFIETNRNLNACIVAPWHPATLQKKLNRSVFILDGCTEWLKIKIQNEEKLTITEINKQIDLLEQMSRIRNSVVVFPGEHNLYGHLNSFGSYSLYADSGIENNARVKDLMQKDAIFDDDFNESELKKLTEDAKMLLNILQAYSKAFYYTKNTLRLVFINPSELQSIISAVYNYINIQRKKYSDEYIKIELIILVKPENKGGKNYLSYWMDNFFSQDEKLSIKIYLNEWRNYKELTSILPPNNDLIFVMDFLQVDKYRLIEDNSELQDNIKQCLFPIVYKPQLMSKTSVVRRIELSQKQFTAEYLHTQIVNCREETQSDFSKKYTAIREVNINPDEFKIIYGLHEKANWVICIDSGLDGALLKKEAASPIDYSIIGFSTGNGSYGQYNLTITARKDILDTIETKFKNRLYQLFHWDNEKITAAAKRCMQEATSLDGISLLSAINQKDNNINEFMAYVLTSYREKQKDLNSPLKILIHLDSYKHWFDDEIKDETDDSKSRPDFLMFEVKNYKEEKISLKATVIECKTANYENADSHIEKAVGQVEHGLKRLKEIFNPSSESMLRRYWYAQLYRALAFAQVTFSDQQTDYDEISAKLRNILEGQFEIEWTGEVLGYWLNMDGDDEKISSSNNISIYNIPQKKIQRVLLADENNPVEYTNIPSVFVYNKEELDDLFDGQDSRVAAEDVFDYESQSENTAQQVTVSTVSLTESNSGIKNTNEVGSEDSSNNAKQINNEGSETKSNEINSYDNLESTRVLIGKDKLDNNVYWEFGNPGLANRHLLITGTSGQGKTYCIQTLLYELTKSNISSVVFDYTGGFTEKQLDPQFIAKMGTKRVSRVVKTKGVPINPFKIYEQDLDGEIVPETPMDVANRVKGVFGRLFTSFGYQQDSAITDAIETGLNKFGENLTMKQFIAELESRNDKTAQSVITALNPFVKSVEFKPDENFDWNEIIYPKEAHLYIFQLAGYDKDMQVMITEFVLWNLWNFTMKFGSTKKPFVVVLDEAQNLSHKDKSPTSMILTEGRKFGWSAWLATQILDTVKNRDGNDAVSRLFQTPFQLFFKPATDEMQAMAKRLDSQNAASYEDKLRKLNKGQCIVVGDRCNSAGTFGPIKPTPTYVLPFNERT